MILGIRARNASVFVRVLYGTLSVEDVRVIDLHENFSRKRILHFLREVGGQRESHLFVSFRVGLSKLTTRTSAFDLQLRSNERLIFLVELVRLGDSPFLQQLLPLGLLILASDRAPLVGCPLSRLQVDFRLVLRRLEHPR